MKLHNYFAVSKLFWKRSIYEMSCSQLSTASALYRNSVDALPAASEQYQWTSLSRPVGAWIDQREIDTC